MPDRAVVAISEDRQWLVVLHPELRRFRFYGMDDFGAYKPFHAIVRPLPAGRTSYLDDTGQDAHEVLAAWLEGRQ